MSGPRLNSEGEFIDANTLHQDGTPVYPDAAPADAPSADDTADLDPASADDTADLDPASADDLGQINDTDD